MKYDNNSFFTYINYITSIITGATNITTQHVAVPYSHEAAQVGYLNLLGSH